MRRAHVAAPNADTRSRQLTWRDMQHIVIRAAQMTDATDSDWKKVSKHPELGAVTLTELFEKADGHIVAHTQQLREIAAHF